MNIRRLKGKKLFALVAAIVMFMGVFAAEVLKIRYAADDSLNSMIARAVSSFLGGGIFVAITILFGYNVLNPFISPKLKNLLIAFPCFLVAINNFPIISVISGSCTLAAPWGHVAAFAAECIGIGFIEELAFRGVIFLSLLEKKHKTAKDVFISIILTSVLFGAVHLVNLIFGADLGGVIMQTGYSFLIGGMCSVVLIKTRNIWLCVLIHGIYDFGGYFLSSVGSGTMWDLPTIIITAILSICVSVYVVFVLIKLDIKEIDKIYENSGRTC